MRVLQLHNFYCEARGGETEVVQAEQRILEAHGHEVRLLSRDNREIGSLAEKVRIGLEAVYSVRSKRRVIEAISAFKPDVVHAHNIYPLLSPSVFYACREAMIPAVMTLHNYRLGCPGGQLLRQGRMCQDCLGKLVPWRGVLHACYRGSRSATASVVAMNSINRFLGTWEKVVDAYIAPSQFLRQTMIQAGLPDNTVHFKPNFVLKDLGVGLGKGEYALYVGRLSPEKGVDTLLSAWRSLNLKLPLKVAGDGPLSSSVTKAQSYNSKVEWLGWQSRNAISALMREAMFLVVPSKCAESFGLVVIEAFSAGTPVFASKIGALAEMVRDGETGVHFQPGDSQSLVATVRWAKAHPGEIARMRIAARAEFMARYTPEANYNRLISIYDSARERAAKAHSASKAYQLPTRRV